MNDESMTVELRELAGGRLHPFGEPLDPAIPLVAAGCYTIWDDDARFVYAGMAGRSLTAEGIEAAGSRSPARVTGLRDRLGSHRSGRRSGDQFCVYVFDRLVLPSLTNEQISAAAAGRLRLDDEVRRFVREHLAYRWVATADGRAAFRLEAALVTEGINGELPLLNPRVVA